MSNTIPLERTITDRILVYLRARGGWWLKSHGAAFQSAGVPDIIGVFMGDFYAFEVKRPKVGHATRLQALVLSRILRAGGVASIVCSVEDVEKVFSKKEYLRTVHRGSANHDENFFRSWYNI